jgi:lactoylglutathione lyase
VAGELQVKLDHIVLLVSDLPRSVGFYEILLPMLGFRKTADHVFGNAEEVYFDIRQAENLGHSYQRYAPGLNHIGFTAPNRDAIAQVQDVMKDAGYEVPDVQSFGEGVALFLKDPDGMRIELGVLE